MLTNRFDTEIILEALCVAIERASDDISVLYEGEIETDEQYANQLKDLVVVFDNLCKEWGVDEVMLDSIKWYDAGLMNKVRNDEIR